MQAIHRSGEGKAKQDKRSCSSHGRQVSVRGNWQLIVWVIFQSQTKLSYKIYTHMAQHTIFYRKKVLLVVSSSGCTRWLRVKLEFTSDGIQLTFQTHSKSSVSVRSFVGLTVWGASVCSASSGEPESCGSSSSANSSGGGGFEPVPVVGTPFLSERSLSVNRGPISCKAALSEDLNAYLEDQGQDTFKHGSTSYSPMTSEKQEISLVVESDHLSSLELRHHWK
jgi:hypothetical protein